MKPSFRAASRWAVWLALASTASAAAPQEAASGSVPGVSRIYEAGSTTVWRIEIEGESIGHNWSRYEGEVSLAGLRAHHFREQVLLDSEVPGGRLLQKYTNELWTNDEGQPLRLQFRAEVSDVRSALDATFDPSAGKAEVKIQQGPAARSQELDLQPGFFVLANNFVSHLDLALAISRPAAGEPATLRFLSANVLREFPLQLEPLAGEDALPGGKVFRDSLGEVLHLDAAGRLARVEVPAQKLAFRRVEGGDAEVAQFTIEPPQAKEEATDLAREEVRIEYGEVSLAGTVTTPRSAGAHERATETTKTTEKYPAVFFISGSGGQDRNGVSSGIDLGTGELLDRLTREGYLVLRIDDRGVGESTGPTEDLSYDDLLEDARQAVRYLQAREDVDASRIVLIGHSEGGQTAPILAAEMELGAIVLMAAPGRAISELIREQLARGAQLQGKTAEERAELDRKVVAFFENVRAGKEVSADDLPAELAAFVGARAWLASHLEQDPIANLRRVEEPVLILQGARDIQVSVERDAQALYAALEAAEHPDVELVVFRELDHLFKKTEGGPSAGLDYLKDRPLDEEFVDTMVSWLSDRLMR